MYATHLRTPVQTGLGTGGGGFPGAKPNDIFLAGEGGWGVGGGGAHPRIPPPVCLNKHGGVYTAVVARKTHGLQYTLTLGRERVVDEGTDQIDEGVPGKLFTCYEVEDTAILAISPFMYHTSHTSMILHVYEK